MSGGARRETAGTLAMAASLRSWVEPRTYGGCADREPVNLGVVSRFCCRAAKYRICAQLRLGVTKVCLGVIGMRVGKRPQMIDLRVSK